ncbi:hypothetical protein K469DRAFT_603490 [Zopfia rhizophila CBS 207.26]|uniref:Heterokaryon incompatibility domain-containing protein n=1 Tax=Zopfia rhizophila CBS 207.26 TaxID=1314779 RepID=A0A6A6DG63_9PEZI|nr:hypothetical protein K469DRAFT_603490 [Zopfia rhizophila CBS 207.26]
MRLIHSTTLELKDLFDNEIPPYAILPHTCGTEEITFEDMQNGKGNQLRGYRKIEFAARQAAEEKLAYIWVDTCCI